MSYHGLTEAEYKEFQTRIVKTQLLPAVHRNVCSFTPSTFKFQDSHTEVTEINTTDFKTWSLAPHAIDDRADVLFKEVNDVYYRLQRTMFISNARLKVSRTVGTPIDTTLAGQITRALDKELEQSVFGGPDINGTRLTSVGLVNEAGNTSTYNTVKFASASGPYNTVNDMVGLCEADGFTGPFDLIVDTTLSPYLRYLPATDASFSERQRILDQLPIKNIYVSDKLPAATAQDGTMMIVENSPLNYEIKTPQGLGLSEMMVYDPGSDGWVGRIEGFYCFKMYQANSICVHTTVDLA
jgi:hypothetical protein